MIRSSGFASLIRPLSRIRICLAGSYWQGHLIVSERGMGIRLVYEWAPDIP